ncbi:hypothetical protein ABMY26_00775 (plasmid) [Azospirillum sp. HJ39]|uniref:hypothetical protein n=1 Tax=Azospirillum sp. HJ39 TaxID=3159496 RepID=UPI003558B94E
MTNSYDRTVADNMADMGSSLSDWQAVPITSVSDDGPSFNMPEGFSQAPSLFGGQADCCELCGHHIKNVFWIQNDKRRWILPVGSECVCHFQEASGEDMAKAVNWQQNRDLLRRAIAARAGLWKQFARKLHLGYGRTETRIPCFGLGDGGKAYDLHRTLTDRIGPRMSADKTWNMEPSGYAVITKWVKRNPDILPLIEQAEAMITAALGIAA